MSDHSKLRPGYPPELYEKILKMTGIPVSLLDVATGSGTVIRDMKPHLCDALGIDSDPEKIKVAKFQTSSHIRFECTSAEKFIPEKEYDLVTIGQGLHGLPLSILRTLHKALKPRGVIALFWKYPDPYSRTTDIVNKVLKSHDLPLRIDMGLKLAQLNPSGILTEWRFTDVELTHLKAEELFTHEEGIKSILRGLSFIPKEMEETLSRELGILLPGSMTEIYDCYLWTARKG